MRIGTCGISCSLCNFYKGDCEGCGENGKECPIVICARNLGVKMCMHCDMCLCDLWMKNLYLEGRKKRSEKISQKKKVPLIEVYPVTGSV